MQVDDEEIVDLDELITQLEEENTQLKKHLRRVLDAFLKDMPTASKHRKAATDYLTGLGQLLP